MNNAGFELEEGATKELVNEVDVAGDVDKVDHLFASRVGDDQQLTKTKKRSSQVWYLKTALRYVFLFAIPIFRQVRFRLSFDGCGRLRKPSEIGAEKMHCKHFQEKEKRIGSNCDGYSCCVLSEALSFPIELLKPVRNPSIFRAGCIVQ